ncbi:hypothetical protein P885DRAFT_74422 [Corynascus similis CBS 632.67]
MPGKRERDEDVSLESGVHAATNDTRKPKKAKHGFRVGPENLPDGAWRRKVTKIKKDLITKAKVKKQYAKIKAQHQQQATAFPIPEQTTTQSADQIAAHTNQEKDGEFKSEPGPPQIHPERQAMLDSSTSSRIPATASKDDHKDNHKEEGEEPSPSQSAAGPQKRPRKQHHRPDYYTKELAAAERAKKKAEERRAEMARREEERRRRIAERERYRRAMAKAKTPGRDGKVKIGRESKLLLERVQKVMGESK